MNNSGETFLKAKEYAFLLLKFRLRSVKEISERLEKKNFPSDVIDKTVSFLKEKKFLDDELFAKSWINFRLQKSLGLSRIRLELRQKGIAKETAEKNISAIKSGYSEKEVVEALAAERSKRLKEIDPRIAKRRLYAYLLRRGFSPEVVIDVVNRNL